MLGVNESVVVLTEIRRRQLPAKVSDDSASRSASPTRRQSWAWLRKMSSIVTRRGPRPAPEAGEAAPSALASAHPGPRG